MSGFRFYSRKIVSFIICVFLCLQPVFTAFAHDSSTLFNGCRSDEVKELQQALIKLGFLKGNADGIFGNNTENAVRRFQKKNKLTVDGLAGAKTRELIMSKAQDKKETSDPVPSPDSVVSIESDSSSDTGSASLFTVPFVTEAREIVSARCSRRLFHLDILPAVLTGFSETVPVQQSDLFSAAIT